MALAIASFLLLPFSLPIPSLSVSLLPPLFIAMRTFEPVLDRGYSSEFFVLNFEFALILVYFAHSLCSY